MTSLVDEIRRDLAAHAGPRPFVVGIAGGVGVGKTTLAHEIAQALRQDRVDTAVLATDNFLLANAELERRGAAMRKGFPDTYDVAAIADGIATLKAGKAFDAPVYDHQTYDIVDSVQRVEPTDVLILEGVNVLQPSVAELVDLAIYVHVDEDVAKAWFLHRFDGLCEIGEGFYASLKQMTHEQRASIAEAAWSGINVVNLRDHIAPTQAGADIVVRKAADHRITSVHRLSRS